jgi:V/A-type H+-transporting ATPase subunit E
MSGIDKILQEIEEEGRAAADRITQEAGEKIENLRKEILEKAQARCEEIRAQGGRESRGILERGESGAELLSRRMILEAKQELLAELLRKAQESIYQMENHEYFALIRRIVAKNALPRPGELLLSPEDRERLPDGFEKELAGLLPEGGSLKVSSETRDIRGGCVLLYDGVEENCSIEALFSAGKDEMTDLARSILFRED